MDSIKIGDLVIPANDRIWALWGLWYPELSWPQRVASFETAFDSKHIVFEGVNHVRGVITSFKKFPEQKPLEDYL